MLLFRNRLTIILKWIPRTIIIILIIFHHCTFTGNYSSLLKQKKELLNPLNESITTQTKKDQTVENIIPPKDCDTQKEIVDLCNKSLIESKPTIDPKLCLGDENNNKKELDFDSLKYPPLANVGYNCYKKSIINIKPRSKSTNKRMPKVKTHKVLDNAQDNKTLPPIVNVRAIIY